jgi:hypothetical protein
MLIASLRIEADERQTITAKVASWRRMNSSLLKTFRLYDGRKSRQKGREKSIMRIVDEIYGDSSYSFIIGMLELCNKIKLL